MSLQRDYCHLAPLPGKAVYCHQLYWKILFQKMSWTIAFSVELKSRVSDSRSIFRSALLERGLKIASSKFMNLNAACKKVDSTPSICLDIEQLQILSEKIRNAHASCSKFLNRNFEKCALENVSEHNKYGSLSRNTREIYCNCIYS